MTVRWTVRAANDRSRDRAARVESLQAGQKREYQPLWLVLSFRSKGVEQGGGAAEENDLNGCFRRRGNEL